MKILVHEFASGGGLTGREVPPTLAREGAAMLAALVSDLAACGHEVVATRDPRFPLDVPPGVDVVEMSHSGNGSGSVLDRLIDSADAVWLVAPETGGCLERLARKVEAAGKPLVGPRADTIRRASDKAALPRLLRRIGVAHPPTHTLRPGPVARGRSPLRLARDLGFPVVVKPARGAGCEGVSLARDARTLRAAIAAARRADGRRSIVLQRYVRGVPASVSLVADGRRAVALALNSQSIRPGAPFSYSGGRTPLDHRLSERAIEAALRVCQSLPGLRGYIGIDLVLARSEAIVIEVNPRLTTAYLGVRAALDANVAALALAASRGTLPQEALLRRSVRFAAGGRVSA
jgi:predicted ATP-grasp superfamily ATP-dependent carboligase